MEDWGKKIVDYLVRNRVSTTEVADVLGKTGALRNVSPVNRGLYRAGFIKWIYAADESNWMVHKQLQDVEDDKIIFAETFNCNDRAIFGELVSKYLLLYHQSRAIVVDGKMRDAAALIKENWPIWCTGFTPVGCYNKEPEKEFDSTLIKEHFEKFDGAIAVCDDCGVVIVPKERINEEFYKGIENIENQEDIWFDRLDHYKESTFDIVCKKTYLDDTVYMERRR